MKIQYIPKISHATTEYRDIQPSDLKYIMNKLREVNELADGCYNSTNSELRKIGHKLKLPNKNLPRKGSKYGGGMNSIQSAASGIVDNIENGTQRDFSNHTCSIISKSFIELANIFPDWEPVTFIPVTEFSTIQQDLFQTTLADHFNTQVYEVTIKRIDK